MLGDKPSHEQANPKIEPKTLNELMMKFTMNKAKDGVKFPVL